MARRRRACRRLPHQQKTTAREPISPKLRGRSYDDDVLRLFAMVASFAGKYHDDRHDGGRKGEHDERSGAHTLQVFALDISQMLRMGFAHGLDKDFFQRGLHHLKSITLALEHASRRSSWVSAGGEAHFHIVAVVVGGLDQLSTRAGNWASPSYLIWTLQWPGGFDPVQIAFENGAP